MRTPVAPTGWPPPIRPPEGLIGNLPPISISPPSIAFQDSPGAVRPRCSMAMYSVVVKQSWVSTASIWLRSVTPAPPMGVFDGAAHLGKDERLARANGDLGGQGIGAERWPPALDPGEAFQG